MSSPATLARPTVPPRRQIGLLTVLSAALLAAFFAVPNALAHQGIDTGNLGASFRRGVVVYWESGSQDFPRELDAAVAFWFRFHLVKAGVSALLLAAVVALGVVLWRQFRRPAGDRPGRLLLMPPGILVALLGPFALIGLVANLQGAAAPFASLLPMLTTGGDDDVTSTVAEIRQQLEEHPSDGHSPALSAMINDFATYHAVLAVMAAVLAVALAAAGVALWKRHRAVSDVRSRRAMKLGITASVALTCLVLIVAVANVTSAADSPRALAGFFNGGW